MAKHEKWRLVSCCSMYEVSSLGRVRYGPSHWKAGSIVPPIREYVRVALYRDGKRTKHLVHGLVAEAFLSPPPKGCVTLDHKNGDKSDNAASNLEWVSQNENQLRAVASGLSKRGALHGRAKLTDGQVREIRARYQGVWGEQTRLAKEYGVSQMLIAKIVAGEIWTHLDPDYIPKVCQNPRVRARRHGSTKITKRQIRAARSAFSKGTAINEIAERFGMDRQIIRDIVYGKTWKHVT